MLNKQGFWMTTVLGFLFLSRVVLAQESAAASLPKEAQELLTKSAALNNYRSRFTLEAEEQPGQKVRLEGTLIFRKPNQRRLELRMGDSKEVSQLLVSDGTTEWQYAPGEGKVYRLANAPEVPGPHQPFAEGKEYKFVGRIGSGSQAALRFEAIPLPAVIRDSPVPIKTLRVDVDAEDGLIRELTLLDEQGKAVLSQRYHDVEVNVSLPKETFIFIPPPGTTVEDMEPPQSSNKEATP